MKLKHTIIAHTATSDQFRVLEAFMKAHDIKYDVHATSSVYHQQFVDIILQGDDDIRKGKGRKITLKELHRFL